jgi:hypothetical protein
LWTQASCICMGCFKKWDSCCAHPVPSSHPIFSLRMANESWRSQLSGDMQLNAQSAFVIKSRSFSWGASLGDKRWDSRCAHPAPSSHSIFSLRTANESWRSQLSGDMQLNAQSAFVIKPRSFSWGGFTRRQKVRQPLCSPCAEFSFEFFAQDGEWKLEVPAFRRYAAQRSKRIRCQASFIFVGKLHSVTKGETAVVLTLCRVLIRFSRSGRRMKAGGPSFLAICSSTLKARSLSSLVHFRGEASLGDKRWDSRCAHPAPSPHPNLSLFTDDAARDNKKYPVIFS